MNEENVSPGKIGMGIGAGFIATAGFIAATPAPESTAHAVTLRLIVGLIALGAGFAMRKYETRNAAQSSPVMSLGLHA